MCFVVTFVSTILPFNQLLFKILSLLANKNGKTRMSVSDAILHKIYTILNWF